jgi:hypothetical protein
MVFNFSISSSRFVFCREHQSAEERVLYTARLARAYQSTSQILSEMNIGLWFRLQSGMRYRTFVFEREGEREAHSHHSMVCAFWSHLLFSMNA